MTALEAPRPAVAEAATPTTKAPEAVGDRVFCEMGLMLHQDGQFFSLALPANPHW